ncbi:MAG: PAS domain S-box protein [Burkholderiales bacterium]|nr:PAS domain S-box protein [Burkholderiales bacterium]
MDPCTVEVGGSAQAKRREDSGIAARSLRNLSAAPRGELAPRQSKLDGRRLYDAMPGIHFVLDFAGTVLSVNPSGAAKLGFAAADLVNADVLKVIHPEDRKAVARQLQCTAEQPDRVFQRDCRQIRKDGTILWVQQTLRQIANNRGAPVILLTSEDISARVAAKRRLARYRRQLQVLTSALSLAEERERRRIASDLHDCVGQRLALTKIKLGALQASAATADVAAFTEIREQLDRAIHATRTLSFDLSSPVLHEVGFAPALAELGERLAKASGLRFELSVEDACETLALDMQVMLYRIAEELLLNVVKHACAKNMLLALSKAENQIRITIEDDGMGLDPAAFAARRPKFKGLGLLSVRERLANLGGRLEIRRAGVAGGTRAIVHAPWDACALRANSTRAMA